MSHTRDNMPKFLDDINLSGDEKWMYLNVTGVGKCRIVRHNVDWRYLFFKLSHDLVR